MYENLEASDEVSDGAPDGPFWGAETVVCSPGGAHKSTFVAQKPFPGPVETPTGRSTARHAK